MNIWERFRDGVRRRLPGASVAIPVPDGWIVDHKSAQGCYLFSPDENASLAVTYHVAEVPDGSDNPGRDLLEVISPTGANIKDLVPGRVVGIYQDDQDIFHWQLAKQVSRTQVEILHYRLEFDETIDATERPELLRAVESCVRGAQW